MTYFPHYIGHLASPKTYGVSKSLFYSSLLTKIMEKISVEPMSHDSSGKIIRMANFIIKFSYGIMSFATSLTT